MNHGQQLGQQLGQQELMRCRAEAMCAVREEEMDRIQLAQAIGAQQRGPLTTREMNAMCNAFEGTADAQTHFMPYDHPTLLERAKRLLKSASKLLCEDNDTLDAETGKDTPVVKEKHSGFTFDKFAFRLARDTRDGTLFRVKSNQVDSLPDWSVLIPWTGQYDKTVYDEQGGLQPVHWSLFCWNAKRRKYRESKPTTRF